MNRFQYNEKKTMAVCYRVINIPKESKRSSSSDKTISSTKTKPLLPMVINIPKEEKILSMMSEYKTKVASLT